MSNKNHAPLASAAAAAANVQTGIDADKARRIMDAMGIRCFASLAAAAAKLEPAELKTIGELLADGKQTAKSQGKPKTRPDYASKKQLLASMQPITVKIAGVESQLRPRSFTTGSIGYNDNRKIEIDGVTYQVTANITAVGSKELPAE
jgi:hypothetical protein